MKITVNGVSVPINPYPQRSLHVVIDTEGSTEIIGPVVIEGTGAVVIEDTEQANEAGCIVVRNNTPVLCDPSDPFVNNTLITLSPRVHDNLISYPCLPDPDAPAIVGG